MKTFEDLEFKPWDEEQKLQVCHPNAKHAMINFPNGMSVSVIACPSDDFYSDGNNYEVAILKEGKIVCTDLTPEAVLGFQTKEQVNEILKQVQML